MAAVWTASINVVHEKGTLVASPFPGILFGGFFCNEWNPRHRRYDLEHRSKLPACLCDWLMPYPWSGHWGGGVVVLYFLVFKMHTLFSSWFWHCNIFLALATICIMLDIHYPVQKYTPTPHTLKNHSSQNSKFRLENVELCRQEDVFPNVSR